MICDSTNVFSVGRAGSELDVRKNLLKVIDRLKKKLLLHLLLLMLLEWKLFFIVQKNLIEKYL